MNDRRSAAAVRPFRFGVVAVPRDAQGWRATARRAEELGYSTLLQPDGPELLAPLPALAVAAGATTTLRVGSYVLAAPLRPPGTVAWEAHTLTVLTAGRFEVGLGTGLPSAVDDARRLGLPAGPPAPRLSRLVATLDRLQELDGDGARTPVLVAVAGPKAVALAAERADTVAFALPPTTGVAEFEARVSAFRSAAGCRCDDVEIMLNLLAFGDDLPAWLEHATGSDPATLRRAGAHGLLSGGPAEVADALLRRRDRCGTSYVTVSDHFLETFAPVVERLAGR